MCIVRYLIPMSLRHTSTVIDRDWNDDNNNYYDDCYITNDDDEDDDDILHYNARCNIEAHSLPIKSMCRCIPDVHRSFHAFFENRSVFAHDGRWSLVS